ncbi:MAG: hypothetical protein WCX28_08090 [Bacteriovoracaceae bacterium]
MIPLIDGVFDEATLVQLLSLSQQHTVDLLIAQNPTTVVKPVDVIVITTSKKI